MGLGGADEAKSVRGTRGGEEPESVPKGKSTLGFFRYTTTSRKL